MSILLIEDDRDLALLWREYLEAKGHPTRLAHSVADATEALTGNMPALLIVDYTLPDGTALDILTHVDALDAVRPHVVVCSGHGHDLPGKVLASGAYILAKPFRLDQLSATVNALLG